MTLFPCPEGVTVSGEDYIVVTFSFLAKKSQTPLWLKSIWISHLRQWVGDVIAYSLNVQVWPRLWSKVAWSWQRKQVQILLPSLWIICNLCCPWSLRPSIKSGCIIRLPPPTITNRPPLLSRSNAPIHSQFEDRTQVTIGVSNKYSLFQDLMARLRKDNFLLGMRCQVIISHTIDSAINANSIRSL